MKKHRRSFSATNPSQSEGKLAYLKLNIPTPCPPPSAVLVYQERGISSFTHRVQFAFSQGCDCASYVPHFYPIER